MEGNDGGVYGIVEEGHGFYCDAISGSVDYCGTLFANCVNIGAVF